MTTLAAAPRARSAFEPSFAFWMTLAMGFFVFGGFGMHSFVPALRGDFPPAPPLVHLHGLVFVAWMILLLVQSALVGGKRCHEQFPRAEAAKETKPVARSSSRFCQRALR